MIEITVKDLNNLQQIIKIIEDNKINHISITNKSKDFTSLDVAKVIRNSFKGNLKISCNYSIQMNLKKDLDLQIQDLTNFLESSQKFSIEDILVVSGNQTKYLTHQTIKYISNKFSISVAFNPFYINYKDQEFEKYKLLKKIENNNIKKIYLQLGEDLDLLTKGIEYIKSLNNKITIIGSILVPNNIILNKLKFRKWRGVFYSKDYLDNLEVATENSKKQVKILKSLGCEILQVIYPIKYIKNEDIIFNEIN